MKRLLVMLSVVAFMAAVPLPDTVRAVPVDRVPICHINSANDVIDFGGGLVSVFGRVIDVDENAVTVHLEHGDSLNFNPLDEEAREFIEDSYGISLPNANCYIPLP